MRAVRGLVALAVVLVSAGCAAVAAPPVGPQRHRSYAADDLALRVELIDGFVPAIMHVARPPLVSVYGDGRVITEGPVAAIYPGPALPNLQLRHISVADVNRLVDLAITAGVGSGADPGVVPIEDAPSTRFLVLDDPSSAGQPRTSTVEALGLGGEEGLSRSQRTSRTRLKGLLDALNDLPKTLGADAVGPSEAYVAAGVAVIATAWTGPVDPALPPPNDVAWPGPPLPGPAIERYSGLGCQAVTGEAATKVLAAAAAANAVTPWASGGARWELAIRPLLPDETSCGDVAH